MMISVARCEVQYKESRLLELIHTNMRKETNVIWNFRILTEHGDIDMKTGDIHNLFS